MKRILSVVLILLGIILIFSSFINTQIVNKVTSDSQKVFIETTVEEIKENKEREATYNFDAIKDVEFATSIIGAINFDDKAVIGQIIIDDLDMNLPVLKGVTNSNLLAGAATMVKEQEMGKGNYPLAGHYMKDPGKLFGGLLDIDLDAIVLLVDKEMVYEYKIYDKVIVGESDFYMIEQQQSQKRGVPIVSLMTCYYTSKNGKRFFALGELVNQYPYEELRENKTKPVPIS